MCWRSHAQTRPTMCQTQWTQLHTEVARRSVGAWIKTLFTHFKLGFVSFQALLKFQLLLQLHTLLKSWISLPRVPQTQKKRPGSWLKGGGRPDWRGSERSRSASKERRRKGDQLVLAQRDAASSSSLWTKIYTMSRRRRDELERRRAEEQSRQEAEAQRLVEEKRRRDEEEQRRAEEERAQALMEAALLQKQVNGSY